MATTRSSGPESISVVTAGQARAGPADGQPGGRPPAATQNEAMKQAVSALQDTVNTALLRSDGHTLDHLVSPAAAIIGPRGFMISRDEWLGSWNAAAGAVECHRLTPAQRAQHRL